MGVGTTIVRDSDPESETAETHAKAAGTLAALGFRAGANDPVYRLGERVYGEDMMISLSSRNAKLSRFWIEDQSDARTPDKRLAGKSAVIIDNETLYAQMLAHMATARARPFSAIVKNADNDPVRDTGDWLFLRAVPGRPRDH
jgi:phenazine biosynthesis protein phzE